MDRTQLQRHLDDLLEAARFKDYCPNGLQVEGSGEVTRVVCGVTASLALIDAAIERGAQAILVHHGWFWRGEDGRITGMRRARIARLLAHDINLFAYHLPLDAHPELGNNAQLGRVLGLTPTAVVGDQGLLWIGEPAVPASAGFHMAVFCKVPINLPLVMELAKKVEVGLYAISGFYYQQPAKEGLYFGFGAIETLDIDIALDRLRDILEQLS